MSSDDHIHFHRRAEDEAPAETPPPGMTIEQLHFFTEQTRRAVRKSMRIYTRSALLGFVILLVGVGVALSTAARTGDDARQSIVQSGKAIAVEGCNRDYVDRQNFRVTLEVFAAAAKRQGNQDSIRFWRDVIALNPQLDCRKAQEILTDDPDATIPVIPPYYSGAAHAPKPPVLELANEG
jgi:hypothetical protein